MSGVRFASGRDPRVCGRMTPTDDSARWDTEAEAFDEAPDHGLRDATVLAAWRSRLVSLLPPSPARVAGPGVRYRQPVAAPRRRGHPVTGADLSPAMVARAVAKADERYVVRS